MTAEILFHRRAAQRVRRDARSTRGQAANWLKLGAESPEKAETKARYVFHRAHQIPPKVSDRLPTATPWRPYSCEAQVQHDELKHLPRASTQTDGEKPL